MSLPNRIQYLLRGFNPKIAFVKGFLDLQQAVLVKFAPSGHGGKGPLNGLGSLFQPSFEFGKNTHDYNELPSSSYTPEANEPPLLWLYQQSAARILDHLVRTTILDLERLNREHEQAIAQIPSVRYVSTGVIHGNLLELGEVTKLPLGSVFLDQAIPQVLPLGVENLVVEGKLPPLLSLYEAKGQFAFFKLASQFVSKAIPSNRTFYQTAIPFLINLNEIGLA